MNLFLSIALSVLAGMLLGGLYFWGLWFTVNKVNAKQKGKGFIFISFLLRIAVLLFAFYLIMQGNAIRLISMLVGFLISRQIILG